MRTARRPTVALPRRRYWYNQPFAYNSHWNTPIGAGASWSASGDADTGQLTGLATFTINSTNFGQPFYVGGSGDPLITVSATTAGGFSGGVLTSADSAHIPIGAAPISSSDHHIHFFDLTQPTKFFSFFNASFNNPDGSGGVSASTTTLSAFSGIIHDSRTHGLGIPGTTNGCFVYGAGTIRAWEWQAGVINHQLRCSLGGLQLRSPTYVSADNNNNTSGVWQASMTWPMYIEDYYGGVIDGVHANFGSSSPVSSIGSVTGQVLYGSTIGIPVSVVDMRTTNPLGLNAGALMVARALQNYGCIINDRTSDGLMAFMTEPSVSGSGTMSKLGVTVGTLYTQATTGSQWTLIKPNLRIMRNQSATTINGGGAPVVPPIPGLI